MDRNGLFGVDKVSYQVALRKESVDRNVRRCLYWVLQSVALRKESVDRNIYGWCSGEEGRLVALRKESVDRNPLSLLPLQHLLVALRKESVDRNIELLPWGGWGARRSPQGERG